MINPLEPCFNFLIQFFQIIPQPIKAFISLYWTLFVVIGVVGLIWKAKH